MTFSFDAKNLADKPYFNLSIPLVFNGEQPASFGAAGATATPYRAGGFVGDTRQGGSCNCEVYVITPHCNGTHTECVGHIAQQRISISQKTPPPFVPALLLSVVPVCAKESGESYDPAPAPQDLLVTQRALEQAAARFPNTDFRKALVIRTLPNEADKKCRDYAQHEPPFFSNEALRWIVGQGVEHLLVDFPSVDKAADEGKLTNHRIFWNEPPHGQPVVGLSNKTITEMIFAPNEAADGYYWLNLQIAPFVADAAPSRPLIFPAA